MSLPLAHIYPAGGGGKGEGSIWGEPTPRSPALTLPGEVMRQLWLILSSTFQGRCYYPRFREHETEAQRGGGSQPRAFGDKLLGSGASLTA